MEMPRCVSQSGWICTTSPLSRTRRRRRASGHVREALRQVSATFVAGEVLASEGSTWDWRQRLPPEPRNPPSSPVLAHCQTRMLESLQEYEPTLLPSCEKASAA